MFDVIKSYRQMEQPEACSRCNEVAIREFVPSHIHFIGTSVQNTEWNPGLGCLVKNKKHREEIAKRKGVVEIGNETTETIHKYFDKSRAEKLDKAYDEGCEGWQGNGDTFTGEKFGE